MLGVCCVVGPRLGRVSGSAQPPASTGDECQFLLNIPQEGSHNPKTIWDAGQDALFQTCVVASR